MNPCCGCGGLFPDVDGPTHAYMLASPGCWAAYGEVLAREYADYPSFAAVHRLTVDAYAAQHPHSPTASNTRSVAIHLCRLCLLLERGLDADRANAAMLALVAEKSRFVALTLPANLGAVTVADVRAAATLAEHRAAVRQWAESVWRAWTPCHEKVRGWIDGILGA